MFVLLVVALVVLLVVPADGHVYGPWAPATVAASATAVDLVALSCPHVAITRQELGERWVAGRRFDVQGRAQECAGGHARVVLDRDVRRRATVCKVLVHEFRHVDGWRARAGEQFVVAGRSNYRHHRSKRSIMHPRPRVPAACSR